MAKSEEKNCGKEKGKKERNIEIAKKMLEDKIDIETIAKYIRIN